MNPYHRGMLCVMFCWNWTRNTAEDANVCALEMFWLFSFYGGGGKNETSDISEMAYAPMHFYVQLNFSGCITNCAFAYNEYYREPVQSTLVLFSYVSIDWIIAQYTYHSGKQEKEGNTS